MMGWQFMVKELLISSPPNLPFPRGGMAAAHNGSLPSPFQREGARLSNPCFILIHPPLGGPG